MKIKAWAQNLPHPAILLDDCPQLARVIEELEAGTYPQPDVAVWRPDLPLPTRLRLARATGATDAQVTEMLTEDAAEERRARAAVYCPACDSHAHGGPLAADGCPNRYPSPVVTGYERGEDQQR